MKGVAIIQAAREAGFDWAGVTSSVASAHGDAFRSWIAEGCHADMAWLARAPERRINPRLADESARSLLVVGLSYAAREPDPRIWADPLRGRLARYAWGPDYHEVMGAMLAGLAETLRRQAGWTIAPRRFVDTAPIFERDAAVRCGSGFVGRSTMFIHPSHGTWTCLGGLILPAALENEGPAPAAPESCPRECGRCLRDCPTGALGPAVRLDARRCLSWLTIENRGVIPAGYAVRMDRWVFGCDRCQETCPWNGPSCRKPVRAAIPFEPDRHAPALELLIEMTDRQFRDAYRSTAVWRSKGWGLARNAVAALAGGAHPDASRLLDHALRHPHPVVRAQAEQIRAFPRPAGAEK